VLIDSPAANPCDERDLTMLLGLAQAASAEPVLVLDASVGADEAAFAARAFARIGARRLVLTKLDVARRKGAALAAAEAGGLAFAQISASPFLVGGFAPATPLRLARLLLEEQAPEYAAASAAETKTEAA
jgi:flagellar biosynthesis protein FlhF